MPDHRHRHEAETYDAMAEWILATWTEADYRVDPGPIPFANREHVDYLTDAVGQLRLARAAGSGRPARAAGSGRPARAAASAAPDPAARPGDGGEAGGALAGLRVLEVGAGGGSLAVWLAHQGAEVVGIDVSGGILDVARRRAEASGVAGRVTFVHAPVETFDPAAAGLDHDRYDAVIGNNVVHHVEREPAMANLARLLAPGGVAVFCEPVLLVPEWLRSLRYSAPVRRRFPPHTHTPDERSLDTHDFAVMRRHFRHVEWKPFQLLCRLQNFVELSPSLWERLEALDRRLLAVPLTRRACRMAVVTLGLPVIGAAS